MITNINIETLHSLVKNIEENEKGLIVNIKEKKKFIYECKKLNHYLVKVKIKSLFDDFVNIPLYMDIKNLKGNKSFYFLPFRDYIDNNWEHRTFSSCHNLEYLLNHIDIYDELISSLSQSEAINEILKLKKN